PNTARRGPFQDRARRRKLWWLHDVPRNHKTPRLLGRSRSNCRNHRLERNVRPIRRGLPQLHRTILRQTRRQSSALRRPLTHQLRRQYQSPAAHLAPGKRQPLPTTASPEVRRPAQHARQGLRDERGLGRGSRIPEDRKPGPPVQSSSRVPRQETSAAQLGPKRIEQCETLNCMVLWPFTWWADFWARSRQSPARA